MDLQKLKRIYQTVTYLKPVQIYHQVTNRLFKSSPASAQFEGDIHNVTFDHVDFFINQIQIDNDKIQFQFLNKSKTYPRKSIDWNEKSYGKLWEYNLNYFDFLHHKDLSFKDGLHLIEDYASKFNSITSGKEPFPISIRNVNWIKYFWKHEYKNNTINDLVYGQYQWLSRNMEYHLLANHLLENLFSLFIGSFYFRDEQLLKVSLNGLKKELNEQFLNDGAHYELSPMYHQIMLYRLFDCYQIAAHSEWKPESRDFLKTYCEAGVSWLSEITANGTLYPHFGDSAGNVIKTPRFLFDYAKKMKLKTAAHGLKASAYRKLQLGELQIFFKIADVCPSYQPGHSHADTLTFVLHSRESPVIVDPGISTYNINERRQLERSTYYHNTVTVNEENSSDIWAGFRIGARASVNILRDEDHYVTAEHDGYRKYKVQHKRSVMAAEGKLVILDEMTGSNDFEAVSCLHFHPDVSVSLEGDIIKAAGLTIILEGYSSTKLISYKFAAGFNDLVPATKFVGRITPNSKISIYAD